MLTIAEIGTIFGASAMVCSAFIGYGILSNKVKSHEEQLENKADKTQIVALEKLIDEQKVTQKEHNKKIDTIVESVTEIKTILKLFVDKLTVKIKEND